MSGVDSADGSRRLSSSPELSPPPPSEPGSPATRQLLSAQFDAQNPSNPQNLGVDAGMLIFRSLLAFFTAPGCNLSFRA